MTQSNILLSFKFLLTKQFAEIKCQRHWFTRWHNTFVINVIKTNISRQPSISHEGQSEKRSYFPERIVEGCKCDWKLNENSFKRQCVNLSTIPPPCQSASAPNQPRNGLRWRHQRFTSTRHSAIRHHAKPEPARWFTNELNELSRSCQLFS